MKIFLIASFVCLSVAAQTESFEKRAISAVQRIPASNLDAKLPNRSFGAWLSGLVGKDSGVVWQLAECGAGAPGGTGQDALACAEATVLLPNGDTVVVGISIGTFKLGLIGEPTFQGAVIKTDERMLQVRRLSDLPGMLPPLNGVSRQPLLRADLGRESRGGGPRPMPDLQVDLTQVPLHSFTYPPSSAPDQGNNNSAPKFLAPAEGAPPPAPPPALSKQSSGKLVDASVISKGRPPVYPPAAKAAGVAGKVEVRVVISESGRVVDATAISGPVMLRPAAVAAARQWAYKPATLNDLPVRTESVLTFTFGNQ
ncbi:MAG TPA: TonB family protein [Blastocatellia bacterium]|nr:TonB family protein [Blastocatellia bacterium]